MISCSFNRNDQSQQKAIPITGPSLQFNTYSAGWTGDSHSHKGQTAHGARVTFEAFSGERITSFLQLVNNGTTTIYYDWKVGRLIVNWKYWLVKELVTDVIFQKIFLETMMLNDKRSQIIDIFTIACCEKKNLDKTSMLFYFRASYPWYVYIMCMCVADVKKCSRSALLMLRNVPEVLYWC